MPYSFDPEWTGERRRLEVQSEMLDAGTIRHLETLGVGVGWRCAEIAAGTGSIALWLSGRVGASGHVVATDVDTRFLRDLRQPNLEVRRHDIAKDSLEESAYDLVHTRLLLMHLASPENAVAHMIAALRPGGWLMIEDYDLSTWGLFHPPSELQTRAAEAVKRLFEINGADPRYGLKLLPVLAKAGLSNVHAGGRLEVVQFGTTLIEALTLKLEQFREKLIQHRLLTEEEIGRAVEEARSPRGTVVYYPPLMVTAWGQRPA